MNLRTGLLLGTNPKHIEKVLKYCFQDESLETLYIKLLFGIANFYPTSGIKINPLVFRRTTLNCYSCSQSVKVDVRVLLTNCRNPEWLMIETSKPIEVIYFDSSFSSSAVESFVHQYVKNKTKPYKIVPFPTVSNECNLDVPEENDTKEFEYYDSVVLGGTFDRLHPGHKILFSEALFRCKSRLTVGVTSDQLLLSKTLCDLIIDCEKRIEHVKKFLKDVDPCLSYDVVEINDEYGPTKTDPTFQMIVVSQETRVGAEKINQYREEVGLNKLDVVEIDLVDCNKESAQGETKISSSNIRMRLLGTLLKKPTSRPHLPAKPYIIGLTGGIASGKSAISGYLCELGCGCINCDELGHRIYDIGSAGYDFVKATFGPDVLNEDGSVNRKQLGSIVFGNNKLLDTLNQGLWPLIFEKVKQMIATSFQNKDVVVIEAALLIQAHWTDHCHEIWSCIIPAEEAIKRLQSRNNLPPQEARLRLDAQLSNKDYVAEANVVLCSYWDSSYTRKQVDKAWYDLQKRLPSI